MSIYITGDCHGTFTKFSKKNFPARSALTDKDVILITGDFGTGPWGSAANNNQKEWEYYLRWLGDIPATFAFADGNHENFDTLAACPVETWNGGCIHRITNNVIHLMRGEIYRIENKSFFVFGGARSHDIDGGILDRNDPEFYRKRKRLNEDDICYRILNESWWPAEMPTEEEIEYGRKKLDAAKWSVNYIITHCGPRSVDCMFAQGRSNMGNPIGDFFEEVMKKCRYSKWYMGHYHQDIQIKEKKIRILYNDILRLDGKETHADIGNRFRYGDSVSFTLRDDGEELRGTVLHINYSGDGLHVTDEPVANIHTDTGRLIKNVAFSRMQKI